MTKPTGYPVSDGEALRQKIQEWRRKFDEQFHDEHDCRTVNCLVCKQLSLEVHGSTCPANSHFGDRDGRAAREDWYQLPDENGNFDFYTTSGKRVGRATSMEYLQAIVSDHAAAALVPELVEALSYVAEVVPSDSYRNRDDSDQVQITVTIGWLREIAEVLAAARKGGD